MPYDLGSVYNCQKYGYDSGHRQKPAAWVKIKMQDVLSPAPGDGKTIRTLWGMQGEIEGDVDLNEYSRAISKSYRKCKGLQEMLTREDEDKSRSWIRQH